MFNKINKNVIPENKFNLTLNLKSSYKENRSIETRIIEKKRLFVQNTKSKTKIPRNSPVKRRFMT
tara:strand:- start:241 stop:435 length:195 start_codon:yes stop_codon:yes gene_type:complete